MIIRAENIGIQKQVTRLGSLSNFATGIISNPLNFNELEDCTNFDLISPTGNVQTDKFNYLETRVGLELISNGIIPSAHTAEAMTSMAKHSGLSFNTLLVTTVQNDTAGSSGSYIHRYYYTAGTVSPFAFVIGAGTFYGSVPCYGWQWELTPGTIATSEIYLLGATDSLDTLYYFDGSTMASIASSPKSSTVAYAYGRTFCAGNPDAPLQITYSDALKPTNFTTGSTGSINLVAAGGKISRLQTLQNRLHIIRYTAIDAFANTAPVFEIQTVAANFGTSFKQAVCQEGYTLYLFNKDGVYQYYSQEQDISGKIYGSLTSTMPSETTSKIVKVGDFLYFYTGNSPTELWMCDTKMDMRWTKVSFPKNIDVLFSEPTETQRLYLGMKNGTVNAIYHFGSRNSNYFDYIALSGSSGSNYPIAATLKTGPLDGGYRAYFKHFTSIQVDGDGTMDANLYVDGTLTGTVTATPSPIFTQNLNLQNGMKVAIQFSSSALMKTIIRQIDVYGRFKYLKVK